MICMHMAKATEFRATKGMCAEHAVVQGMLWNHPLLGSRLGEWHPTALFLFHANTSGIPFQPQKKIKLKKKIHPLKVNYTFPILVAFSAISTTAFFPAVSLGERRWLFFLPFTSGEQSSEMTQPRPKLKPPGQVLNHLRPWLHPSPCSMSALTLSLCIHFCTYVWLWLCYFTSWCCSDPK